MSVIDTHSHIHFSKEFPDLDAVLQRATASGVSKQVLVGCNMSDSQIAHDFAVKQDCFAWTVGIHPHDANQANSDNLAKIRLVCSGKDYAVKKPAAIGEIGLDYFRNLQPVDIQKMAFREMLKIAIELDLPVVVHIRDAYDDAFEILAESGVGKVILHCFSGGLKEAELAWGRGYITSFSGVVTYPKNLELQNCAKIAPINQFVVETDCPFLAPQSKRGQRNEPAFVVDTLKFIADLRGVDFTELAASTTKNAERFFNF